MNSIILLYNCTYIILYMTGESKLFLVTCQHFTIKVLKKLYKPMNKITKIYNKLGKFQKKKLDIN